jgi:dihydropteroate synthase
MKLTWNGFDFDFSKRAYIMGILNITPDSFSDGGLFFNEADAVERALVMEAEGADIIDIGGESTRPGAEKVPVKDEIRRVIPVIEAIAPKVKVPISIDTYKASVAKAAVTAGASMINDISGLRFDPDMAKIAAKLNVPVVIMHMKGTPKNMQSNPQYRALIPEITDYFHESISIARKAGVHDDMIILDPGIGFGKTVEHNLEIIRRLNEFTGFEMPILLGHSRKSFIGKILGDLHVDQRFEGTAAVTAVGIMNGANIIRVHDIRQMVSVVKIAFCIKNGIQTKVSFG